MELYSAKEAGLSPEMVLNLTLVTTVMRETVPKMLPGLLMSMVIITVWINMVLANSLAGRLTGIAPWNRFTTWKLPEQLVWIPITGILIILSAKAFCRNGRMAVDDRRFDLFLSGISRIHFPVGTLEGPVICQGDIVRYVYSSKVTA